MLVAILFALSAQAQHLQECRENRVFEGQYVQNCETRQVVVGCKADSIIDFFQNAYTSDTIVNGKVCKVLHPAIVRKRLVFLPQYEFVQVCKVEITGDVIREIYIDCPPK